MRTLYPEISAFDDFYLDVSDGHSLYVEQAGNPDGIPALFLHGGPGAGFESYHRRFFDPDKYRVVLFDQRGAGRSRPHAGLENNTTQKLVEDIEALREHLGITKWLIFGGSWGSTLALVYAQTHPEAVSALVVRGIFMCRPKEIEWFYQQGADRIFPDYWQDYIAPIPESERGNLLKAFYQQLTSEDEAVQHAAAQAWSVWEGRTATLLGRQEVVDFFSRTDIALAVARIEAHYFMHDAFLETDQILRDADRIRHIPAVIVQGRYDIICPMDSAWALHEVWPEAQFNIVADAGHAASEPGIIDALVSATDHYSTVL